MQQTPTTCVAPLRLERKQALRIVGLRGRCKNVSNVSDLWRQFAPHIGHIPGQVGNVAYGVVFDQSEGFDYVCGVEVSGEAEVSSDFITLSIPSLSYAVFPHHAHVSKIKDTCSAIFGEWFPASEYKSPKNTSEIPRLLEYYGPGFNPQTGIGDMEIWVVIEKP
jgi:AraC family transcriptional regulator